MKDLELKYICSRVVEDKYSTTIEHIIYQKAMSVFTDRDFEIVKHLMDISDASSYYNPESLERYCIMAVYIRRYLASSIYTLINKL